MTRPGAVASLCVLKLSSPPSHLDRPAHFAGRIFTHSHPFDSNPEATMSAATQKIQRAILSVTDKTGLVDFARKLAALGIELISTGGTAKLLRDSRIPVKDI